MIFVRQLLAPQIIETIRKRTFRQGYYFGYEIKGDKVSLKLSNNGITRASGIGNLLYNRFVNPFDPDVLVIHESLYRTCCLKIIK